MEKGIFTISLDFELHWGMFDHTPVENKIKAMEETRRAIPLMLHLFEKYEIEVTWAIVGMLYNKNRSEWQLNKPLKTPSFDNKKLSAYTVGDNTTNLDKFPHCYFAPDLIELIKKIKSQEIGTHTYAHYYCLESGQNEESFDFDLKKVVEISSKNNMKIQSIVFPRNQFNEKYSAICSQNGIVFLRTNPNSWFWNNVSKKSLSKKIARTLDCYLPISKTSYSKKSILKDTNGISYLPASRFFKPPSGYKILDRLRIVRIKNEMLKAARNNEVYHLWWHPHNFSNNLENSINELNEILEYFNNLKEKFGMTSKSMKNTL